MKKGKVNIKLLPEPGIEPISHRSLGAISLPPSQLNISIEVKLLNFQRNGSKHKQTKPDLRFICFKQRCFCSVRFCMDGLVYYIVRCTQFWSKYTGISSLIYMLSNNTV